MNRDSSRRRRPGGYWRFLAHEAPQPGERMCGPAITDESTKHPPSIFDEIVVDRWLHVEQMDVSRWWMNVGGVTVWIEVSRDGKPRQVTVYGPGDYDDPAEGCDYSLAWSAEDTGRGPHERKIAGRR